MPGYTHLQHAQPISFGHHLLACYQMFTRDHERFTESLKRIDISPLGSAALAGTTFPIDRSFAANELGFSAVYANSLDAVSDRDFILEFLSNASLLMMHLSRFCEEIIFGVVTNVNTLNFRILFNRQFDHASKEKSRYGGIDTWKNWSSIW
ncbi:lyase family protein [Enterococcus mundtii]|nr:lyase family protein [Enterococcus mundtii]